MNCTKCGLALDMGAIETENVAVSHVVCPVGSPQADLSIPFRVVKHAGDYEIKLAVETRTHVGEIYVSIEVGGALKHGDTGSFAMKMNI